MWAERLHAALVQLSGVRQWGVSALLGAIGSLAFAPFHLVFALVPALTGLLWFVTSVSSRRTAFAIGWWFGVGHFVAGFYWVGQAFRAADIGVWWGSVAVGALAAASALSIAVVAAACNAVRVTGVGQVAVFASLWTFAEWGRSFVVLGGFPWNLMGYVWGFSDNMIQVAAVTGVFGISAVTVFGAAVAVTVVKVDGRFALRRWIWVGVAAAGLTAIWAGGALRLSNAHEDMVEGVRLRIVQANIAQHHKWLPDLRKAHFAEHLALTQMAAMQRITHVIWPETATPYALGRDDRIRQMIGAVTPPDGLLITGAIRISKGEEAPQRIWNSLRAISVSGDIVGSYDKMRLVPFGEYVPLRDWLPIDKLVEGSRDYSRGNAERTLELEGLPLVGPLICFEVIFPGSVVDKTKRPQWLLNLTNDAWYGNSTGPYQHLVQARFRSVEEGLPLIRAANTGISAAVDAYGRVVTSLGLGERGVLDTGLPVALVGGTFYGKHGNFPVLCAMGLIFAIALVGGTRRA